MGVHLIRARFFRFFIAIIFTCSPWVEGIASQHHSIEAPKADADKVASIEAPKEAPNHGATFSRDGFSLVAKKASPSVVTIRVTGTQLLSGDLSMLSDQELYGLLLSPIFPKPERIRVYTGGTGFVVQAQNHKDKEESVIVTNHHVVASAVDGQGSIQVIFQTGESFPAKIIAVDPLTDLAVLRIGTKKKIPALKWGSSKDLKVGAFTVAIGAPGGGGSVNRVMESLDFTVTHGIVSSVDRVMAELKACHITHFIQTDAPVNPGNSGGPLLDIHGDVIGVNSMGVSTAGGSIGLNMAIPSDLAQAVVAQLAKGAQVVRGYIGIQIGDEISADMAAHFGMASPQGVIIDSIFLDSPAQRAGLQEADVILAVNDTSVFNHQQARAIISAAKPGTLLKIKFWRRKIGHPLQQEGREVEVNVFVGELPNQKSNEADGEELLKVPEFGASFRFISSLAMARMRMNLGLPGAIVIDTVQNASDRDSTVIYGDVVLKIEDTEIKSLDDVRYALNAAIQRGDRRVLFFVARQGEGGYRRITKILSR
jgi:serine protease Do